MNSTSCQTFSKILGWNCHHISWTFVYMWIIRSGISVSVFPCLHHSFAEMIVFKLLNWLYLLCTTAHLFEWIGGECSFLSDFWQLLCFKSVIIYLWCVYFLICFMCTPLYCSAKDILIFYANSLIRSTLQFMEMAFFHLPESVPYCSIIRCGIPCHHCIFCFCRFATGKSFLTQLIWMEFWRKVLWKLQV